MFRLSVLRNPIESGWLLFIGFAVFYLFNFLPVWAKRFFGAVRGGDRATVQHHLRDFVMPYIGIRNRAKGYAVSIVKAGCALVGRPAGKMREPLTDLKPADIEDLRQLIERAQRLA